MLICGGFDGRCLVLDVLVIVCIFLVGGFEFVDFCVLSLGCVSGLYVGCGKVVWLFWFI